MGFDIAETAQGAAGGIVGAGLGLLLEGHNDKRQIRQQKALQDIQMTGNMAMMDYNQKKQMENWQNTSYPAQMEQMKKAGLNPGLMYGMGGGGGQSMGGGGGGISGATAGQNTGEVQQMSGMGIQTAAQVALLKAQKENIDADTRNKEANTGYTSGAQTEATTAQASKTGTETEYLNKSMNARLEEITANAVKAIQEAQQSINNTNVSDATIQDRIKQIKEDAIGSAVKNQLTRLMQKTESGKPALQKSQINLQNTEIKRMIQQGVQDWENLRIQGQNANTQSSRTQNDITNDDIPESTKALTEIAEKIAQAIMLKNLLNPNTRNTIQGFKR